MLGQLGLFKHLSLSPCSPFTWSLQHMSLKVVKWLTCSPGLPRGMQRPGKGGEKSIGEERPPITFCDLTSKVKQPHFLHTLLVKAVTKVHPGLWGGSTSHYKKSKIGMLFSGAIFRHDNLPHSPRDSPRSQTDPISREGSWLQLQVRMWNPGPQSRVGHRPSGFPDSSAGKESACQCRRSWFNS